MSIHIMYSFIALLSLLPAALVVLRKEATNDRAHWAAIVLGVMGTGVWALALNAGTWHVGLGTTLWTTVAITFALFAMVSWSISQAWRLTPLMAPYMIFMGIFGVHWPQDAGMAPQTLDGWVLLHIGVSVVTYGLVTISAVAALAAFLQERALKNKRPTKLTHKLPSVTDCEFITVRLLGWGEAILGLGLATGMATSYHTTGALLSFDHKTVLSILAFGVIGALLYAHHKTGMRGRKAARVVLLAYLLLTLGYLGVKVVTSVLLG
ncbi:cytochrome c biogenesis protein CcsA [Magnetovibrio sp. PR-2]|uniref:cytochrome C assembly family protein n=1 Tax=Magnetovibrio sp. PR-2 TaxID=3120356 RepID=UPI002FCE4674